MTLSDKIKEKKVRKKYSLKYRKQMSERMEGKSIKRKGQFKEGNVPWNKSPNGGKIKRLQSRYNGKPERNSRINYMKYNNLKKIPEGFIIHHIDENPLNDDIKNLRMMWKPDHIFLHNMLAKERLKTQKAVEELKERIKIKHIENVSEHLLRGINQTQIYWIDKIFGKFNHSQRENNGDGNYSVGDDTSDTHSQPLDKQNGHTLGNLPDAGTHSQEGLTGNTKHLPSNQGGIFNSPDTHAQSPQNKSTGDDNSHLLRDKTADENLNHFKGYTRFQDKVKNSQNPSTEKELKG